MRKRLLIFHPALAPYRIDQFNYLSELFDLEVVFLYDNLWNHKFVKEKLQQQLKCKYSFLLKGLSFRGRVFRFGILRKIKELKPDLIFGYEFSIITQYLIILKRLKIISPEIGSFIDDSAEICKNIQSMPRLIARKYSVKHLNYLVLLSDEVADFFNSTFNNYHFKTIVSPILQDPNRLLNNRHLMEEKAFYYINKFKLEGKKVLLFVGRFIQEKGLSGFILNCEDILKKNDDIIIILIGSGPEKSKIQLIINEKKIAGKVIMPGRFESEELYAWYLSASGFILPSIYERFGAVLNEALIFGLKVFCSKLVGASFLINPDNGILFNPKNKNETEIKLKQFISGIEPVEITGLKKRVTINESPEKLILKEWRNLAC